MTCGGGLQAAVRICECANADGSGCEGFDTDLRLCATNDCSSGAEIGKIMDS